MGASLRSYEGIAWAQNALFSLYKDFKRTGNNVCDLVVFSMRMGGAHCPLVKLDQHRHQARRMSHDFRRMPSPSSVHWDACASKKFMGYLSSFGATIPHEFFVKHWFKIRSPTFQLFKLISPTGDALMQAPGT